MAGKSPIEWTEHTWNPIVGCSIVSPGCTNCYAMRMAARIEAMIASPKRTDTFPPTHYRGTTKKVNGNAVWSGKVALAPDHILREPMRRAKPTTYFVNSMGDLFHEDAPDEWIDRVFAVMALCPQHTFQVLTKRAEQMRAYFDERFAAHRYTALGTRWALAASELVDDDIGPFPGFPLPNVWLGVSCERQQEADERIPLLLQTPAAIRFISAEPLLGPIELKFLAAPRVIKGRSYDEYLDALHGERCSVDTGCMTKDDEPSLDWVIVGGESGPSARPFHVEWADAIVTDCHNARVPCFVKQLGSAPMSSGYPYPLRSRKGGDPAEWPARLNVREMPSLPSALAAPQNKPAQVRP